MDICLDRRHNWNQWGNGSDVDSTSSTFSHRSEIAKPPSLRCAAKCPTLDLGDLVLLKKLLRSFHCLISSLDHWELHYPISSVLRVIMPLSPAPCQDSINSSVSESWITRENPWGIWKLFHDYSNSSGVMSQFISNQDVIVRATNFLRLIILISREPDGRKVRIFKVIWYDNNNLMVPESTSEPIPSGLIHPHLGSDIQHMGSAAPESAELPHLVPLIILIRL